MRTPEEMEHEFGFIGGLSIFSNTEVIKEKLYEFVRAAQTEAYNAGLDKAQEIFSLDKKAINNLKK